MPLLASVYAPLRPLVIAARRLMQHDGVEIAGFIAYTGLVSLFPFVIFLFSLAGFLGSIDTAEYVTHAAFEMLPGEVARTLSPIVREIFSNYKPGLLTLSIIGTLWVTSSGIEALRLGCMRSFEMRETRPLWRRRLGSVGFIAIGAIGALSASLIVVVAPLAMEWLRRTIEIPAIMVVLSTVLRLALASGLIAGTLALLYRYLPVRTIAWSRVWPGAWLAAFFWITLASLFSYYLSRAGNYTMTYGSLGGVIATLLFLHFSALIFLLGAEYNAVVAHGRRDAASDSVALRPQAD